VVRKNPVNFFSQKFLRNPLHDTPQGLGDLLFEPLVGFRRLGTLEGDFLSKMFPTNKCLYSEGSLDSSGVVEVVS
jgi:hypothetical protein